ncbi:WG repeat-containing protein [Microcoleus sp. N9_B4]
MGDRPQVSSVGSFSEGLAAVKRNGKSGLINQAGKLVI